MWERNSYERLHVLLPAQNELTVFSVCLFPKPASQQVKDQSRLVNNQSNELCSKYRKGVSLTNSKGIASEPSAHFISWMPVQQDVYQKLY
jgi:hypothetical protein